MESFWEKQKVLITGHSGFKGSWLSYILSNKGAEVFGISLPPKQDESLFKNLKIEKRVNSHFINICDYQRVSKAIKDFSPTIVFHLAAQAYVRESYRNPIETFETNIIGTANILNSLRLCSDCKAAVFITTDKVYKEKASKKPFKEDDYLGGRDPYSASKSASEHVIESYRRSFLENLGISISSARAGNVIGGGDWSEDRIIPDTIKCWTSKSVLTLRKPNAIRPWQHVLEPIFGYIKLAEQSYFNDEFSSSFNFGPNPNEKYSVVQVVKTLEQYFKKYQPKTVIKEEYDDFVESDWLLLDNSKSKEFLKIKTIWDFEKTMEKVGMWYSSFYDGVPADELCDSDIEDFRKSSDE